MTAPRRPGPRPHSPLRPLGPPARRGGWSSFSPRRKFRLIRTGVMAVVLVLVISLLVSQCGDDGGDVRSEETTTTTAKAATTTTAPPLNLRASLVGKGLPSARYQGSAVEVGGKVLLFGGLSKAKSSTSAIWSFDPSSGTTTPAGNLTATLHDAAAGVIGTTAFVYGGTTPKQVIGTAQQYTPGDKTAAQAGQLPSPRSDAVAVSDRAASTIYLVGGWDGANPTTDVLTTTDGVTFNVVTTLAEPVRFPGVALVGTDLWVFGGEWNDTVSSTIQKVDLATRQAKVVAQMPQAVSHAMAFVIEDTIFLAGGRVGGGRSNEIRRFDPRTATFAAAGTLASNLSDASVAVVGSSAYLFGGLAPLATSQIQLLTPAR